MIKTKFLELAGKINKNASDIARETGINRNTINALLHGKIDGIRFSTLEKICSMYGVTIPDLIEYVGEDTKNQTLKPIVNNRIYKQEAECFPFTFLPWFLVAGWYRLKHGGREYSFGSHVDMYVKEDYGAVYWDYEALHNLSSSFYKEYGQHGTYETIYRRYLVSALEIETLYSELSSLVFNSRDILQGFFKRLCSAYDGFWEHSLFIDAFDTGVDHEKIIEISKAHGFTQKEMEILTTPSQLTFFDERKLAFLELMKKLNPSEALHDDKAMEQFLKKHERHIFDYRTTFDYYRSTYAQLRHITLEDVAEQIREYISDKPRFKEEMVRLENYQKDKQRDVAAILKKYKLKENPLEFFSALTYWREHRKKHNLMGIHCLFAILEGLERLTGINRKYLGYLSFDEVDNVLKGLLSESVLAKRRSRGILLTLDQGNFRMFEDKEAVSLRDNLEALINQSLEETDIIRGQVASQGYAKGTARIVMTEDEFELFREGEVLVTSMTRPEFVPLMRKAAAIVTNEGGITCHAAIVSRELGKPCIIGTKNATKLIKNGDIVEVRANHGTIRILRT